MVDKAFSFSAASLAASSCLQSLCDLLIIRGALNGFTKKIYVPFVRLIMNFNANFSRHKNFLSQQIIDHIYSDIHHVLYALSNGTVSGDFAQAWYALAKSNRRDGSKLYNSLKTLPSVYEAAIQGSIKFRTIRPLSCPSILDINLRVDAFGEQKYLFDWHQDFWFLMASRSAAVIWIPLVDLDKNNGGIALAKSYNTDCPHGVIPVETETQKYESYSSSIRVRDHFAKYISESNISLVNDIKAGDAIIFDFLTPHASLSVLESKSLRLTLQIRIADFDDHEYKKACYRKCRHDQGLMEYRSFIDNQGYWNGNFP